MARLLPSTPDTSSAEEADPRVIGLDSERADDLLAAMSSETARELLCALHEDPAAPSELADRVDTSLQNAQYHLDNLREAGAIEVVDTVYSEKGREMKVYAPADKPLVVIAGDEEETSGLKTALTSLIGGLGVLAVLGAVLNVFADSLGLAGETGSSTAGGVVAMDAGTPAATGGGAGPLIDLASPGALFFFGGALVLLAGFGLWYARGD